MLRYALQRYRTPILATVGIGVPFQVMALLAQDFGVLPWVLPFINRTIIIWGILPALILPLGIGIHSSREAQENSRSGVARRAWYLGVMSILLPSLASVGFGLLHFYFGLTFGILSESEGNGLAIGLVLGFILSLWMGAIMGWLGYLIGRALHARQRKSAI